MMVVFLTKIIVVSMKMKYMKYIFKKNTTKAAFFLYINSIQYDPR